MLRTVGRTTLALMLAAVMVVGCKRGGSSSGGGDPPAPPPPPPPPPPLVVDLDVDTNRNGTVDNPADESGEDAWTTALGAVFYFNIDDDNNNNAEDHLDTAVNGATDAIDLARILIRGMSGAPTDATAVVSVSTSAQSRVRIFQNASGVWTQVFAGGASFSIPIADIIAGDVELGIEARARIQPAWDGRVTLTLEIREAGGLLIGSDAVLLRSAPWIMSSNLWPVEDACVVTTGSPYSNTSFRTTLAAACSAAGITLVQISGSSYSDDRWVQDSHETGAVYLPASGSPRRRVDQVLQCARWREIDDWCENVLFGPEVDFVRRFSSNTSSMNYGGNLEVTGPLTNYPWGRILVGGGTSAPIGGGSPITRRFIQIYRDYLNALDIQGPYLEVSSEWLAVGHVDEHTMVIPAPANPRGWAILIASPDLARQNLQDVSDNAGGSLTVFAGRSGWQTTVDAILGNTALMTYNDEVQVRMDAIRLVYQNQLGLADSEIIDLPVLFEDAGGAALAYNPGVINMVVMPSSNGTTYLVIPDPEGPDQPSDVWQAETTSRIQALFNVSNPVSITYADVFNSYHILAGEAHCGVNWVRTPPAQDWWDD